MLDDLQMKASSATTNREALTRELETADPSRRAELEQQLVSARDVEGQTGRDLARAMEEQNGFAAAVAASATTPENRETPETTTQTTEQPSPGDRKPPETVRTYVREQQARLGGLGSLNDRVIEVHTHPDIIEARQANARTAQIRAQLEAERSEKAADQAKQDERDRKDQDRASRIFDGMPSRGFSTKEYLQMEADHRRETAAYSDNAKNLQKQLAAEQTTAVELTVTTGVEHVVLEPEAIIEGEIIEVVEVREAAYYTVAFSDDRGQSHRALVPAAGHDYRPGDEIRIERAGVAAGAGYHVSESRDYGR